MSVAKFILLAVAQTTGANQPAPIEFTSVFVAYGQVTIHGFGAADKARITGCGADGWTDSGGRFTVSGKVRGSGSCNIQVSLPGCEGQAIPLIGPAGSIGLGTIVLQPLVKGAVAGTISFLSIQAPPEVKKLKLRAQEHGKKAEWKEAQRHLEASLKKYDVDPEAWLGLGIVHKRQGDAANARTAFEKAAALDPRFALPFVELAVIALEEKDWPKAIALCQRALAVNPGGLAEAHLYLSTAYLNTADYAAAEREARKAIEVGASGIPKARHILGIALAKQGRVAESIAELQRFVDKAPNTPDADVARQHIRILKAQSQ